MIGVKVFCVFNIVLLICLSFVECSVFITRVRTHPDHPGKCWSEEKQKAYKPGEFYNVDKYCARVVCERDFTFSGFACSSSIPFDEGCFEIEGDTTQSYPDCCPTFKCISNISNNFISS